MNIVRLAKSGTDWSLGELNAYNIVIHEQDQAQFFGSPPLPAYSGPKGFLKQQDRVPGLDSASLSLIKRLDLAMKVVGAEESAVSDFAAALLLATGYEREDTLVRTRKNLLLQMCGEMMSARPTVCVVGVSELILLVQEDKTQIDPSDPEARLIADAVAAFQQNNVIRERDLFLPPLETEMIAGITMVGSFPRFYKIKVTTELDMAVRIGLYPTTQTVVYRHTPRVPRRRGDGMRPLDNRRLVLQCYEAFKQVVYPDNEEEN